MQKGRERRGRPGGLATWRLASGGSTAGAVDRGCGRWSTGPPWTGGVGWPERRRRHGRADELAVEALPGTGSRADGTGVVGASRRT